MKIWINRFLFKYDSGVEESDTLKYEAVNV
jgi:hypothetical protein